MLLNLIVRLWNDEAGSVIATEYLMLGSIVAVGGASGMVAMRDAMTDEYKEFGQSVRQVRQDYAVPAAKGGSGGRGGTTVANPAAAPAQAQAQFQSPDAVPYSPPQVAYVTP